MNNRRLFLLVFSVVLLSRLPFLDAGFGNDPDGWRVATTARYIATNGEYYASRFPGFPVVELICALVWKHGALAMNFLTALVSAVAVGMLSLIAKHYACKDAILLALTFAFTPIVFINSTITMDYLWAVMLVMLSWYAGLKGKPISAGLLLGVAVGCRITTAAIALPFALLFFEKSNWKSSIIVIVKYWIATGVVMIIVFVPVFHVYGLQFFTFFDQGLPPFYIIARYLTVDIWGVVGAIAVVSIPVLMLLNRKKNSVSSIPKTISPGPVNMWIAVLILFVIEFIANPREGAYLIPAIPFFLLLTARYIPRVQYITVCLFIIISSFVVSIDSADRPWNPEPSRCAVKINIKERTILVDFLRGSIFTDYFQRLKRIEYTKKVIQAGDNLKEPSVVIVGVWLSYIIEMTPNAMPESEFPDYLLKRGIVEYIPLLTPEYLSRYRQEGRRMYYIFTVDQHNMDVTMLDIKQAGAVELKLEK